MNTNNLSMKGSRIVHTEHQARDDHDTSRDSSRDRQTEYHNSRRDDEKPRSRSGRKDSDRSDRRDDRQSGNSDWMEVDYSRRGGWGASRGDSDERRSRNGHRWRD